MVKFDKGDEFEMIVKIILWVLLGLVVIGLIIYGLVPRGPVGAMDEFNLDQIERLKNRDLDRDKWDEGSE